MYFNSMEKQHILRLESSPSWGEWGDNKRSVCKSLLEPPLKSLSFFFLNHFRQLTLLGVGEVFKCNQSFFPGEVVVYFHDTPWLGMVTLDPHATNPSPEPLGFDEPRRPEAQDTL